MHEVSAMLKAIPAQEDKEAAREKAALVAEKLRKLKLDRAAEFVEKSVEETLSYMDFPYEHWSRCLFNAFLHEPRHLFQFQLAELSRYQERAALNPRRNVVILSYRQLLPHPVQCLKNQPEIGFLKKKEGMSS